MSYKTILLNLNIDEPVAAAVRPALDLSRRLDARLIGVCSAEPPMLVAASPEGAGLAVEAWEATRRDIETRVKSIEAEFRRLTFSVDAGWRSDLCQPTRALVDAARVADLILMTSAGGVSPANHYCTADPGGVILAAGRPVLILADEVEQVSLDLVCVAWKDTREARRAMADALPLLAAAKDVKVVAAAREVDKQTRDGLHDAAEFLTRHQIKAKPELLEEPDEVIALVDFVETSKVDLVVSGGYGHSRLREWMFGGVTRSLLGSKHINRFMSA